MTILIPVVGQGNTKSDTIYMRGLHEVRRKTILQYVYESLSQIENSRFVIVLKREDVVNYHIDDMIRLLIPEVEIVIADGQTAGSACSCLLAVDMISGSEPLIIAGCDQLFLENPRKIISDFMKHDYDGGVVIFDDIHPRWSFVRTNQEGLVIEAAEKRPISRNACSGFYYFKNGIDFVQSAESMILKGASINGSYYVAPVFNEMVLLQKKIGSYKIDKGSYFNFKQDKGIEEYERYLQENT